MGDLTVFVCTNYLREYRSSLNSLGYKDLLIESFPCYCQKESKSLKIDWSVFSGDAGLVCSKNCVPHNYEDLKDSMVIHKNDFCQEHLIDQSHYNSLIRDGSYLVTYDWIVNWENRISEMGFTRETVNLLFKNWCKKIILISSEKDEFMLEKLSELSELVSLPGEVRFVNLKRTEGILENLYLKWKLKKEKELYKNEKYILRQRVAEAETMRNLLEDIVKETTLQGFKSITGKILELLFGIQNVEFHIHENHDFNSTADFTEDLNTWNLENDRLILNFCSSDRILGKCVIQGLLFPEMLPRYRSLITSINHLLSMALLNILDRERIKYTEKVLKETFDIYSFGIALIDKKEKVLLWNTKFEEILAKTSFDFHSGSIMTIVKDSFTILGDMIAKAKESMEQQSANQEVSFIVNNRTVYLEPAVFPIIEHGVYTGSMVILKDITIEKSNFENKLKIERLKGLSVVGAGIAHEFNNILTSVYGFMDLAKYTDDIEKIHSYLEKSSLSITKVKELTGRLISITEGGILQKKKTGIHELINNVLQFLTFKERSYLNIMIEQGIPEAMIDMDKITSAILNILRNAFTSLGNSTENPPEVIIHASCMDNDVLLNNSRTLRISISDNGKGISRHDQDKIFDPLFTTDVNRQGLGLTIAQAVVNKHKGILSFSSEPARLTTFTIILPME